MENLVKFEDISTKIYRIRGVNVMMDRDLAKLYGVETKVLKQSVRRNIGRFPEDFMFELTKEELENWRSQFVTSNSVKMGLRYSPMVFTDLGVSMLSSVLNSEQAIKINIQIMRIFSKIKSFVLDTKELKKEIDELKSLTDERFQIVFEALDQIMAPEKSSKKKIGFIKEEKKEYV